MNPDCQNCKNRNCFIINHFHSEQINSINNLKKVDVLKKNNFVYKKGNLPKGVYILYDGCIEIINKSKSGDKKEIYFVEPGELFGYRSLITEEAHNTSAKVYKNSKVCRFSKEDFFKLFIKDEKLALKFVKFLSLQLNRREKKLESRINTNNKK